MAEVRDWLVLSVKWSRGSDWLVWYRTADQGYTTDLMQAGRYTAEEARGRECEGKTMAVSLAVALRLAKNGTIVPAESMVVEKLRGSAAADREAWPNAHPDHGRLDWLNLNPVKTEWGSKTGWRVRLFPRLEGRGVTIRSAIDAVMRQQLEIIGDVEPRGLNRADESKDLEETP